MSREDQAPANSPRVGRVGAPRYSVDWNAYYDFDAVSSVSLISRTVRKTFQLETAKFEIRSQHSSTRSRLPIPIWLPCQALVKPMKTGICL